VGGHHTNGAPGLDFLDQLSQTTGNAQAPDRESVRYACLWKATIMLFSRYKVAHGKKRKIMRNVAPVAELQKSFFAGIDKVETRDDLERLDMKLWTARREFSRQFCVPVAARRAVPYCAKLHHANNERFVFHYAQHEVWRGEYDATSK
jgi:hypothetical protein